MTEHDTIARNWRDDWTLMCALHDAFRRDLGQFLDTTAGSAAVRARWQIFRGQLHFHHTAEDTAMWPLPPPCTSAVSTTPGPAERLVTDRVAGRPDGMLAVGDSRPGAGWPAIGPATGMDAVADLDLSPGRPYDLGAGQGASACDSPATHSVLYESTA